VPKNSVIVKEDCSLIGMISSTEVARRVKESKEEGRNKYHNISGLVTKGVLDYIIENDLY
jgi:hypothetical protein